MATGSLTSPAPIEHRTWKQRLLSPWGVAAILLAGFLAVQGWQAWRDRALYDAINQYPQFAEPPLPLEFSRTIQFDPLTFVGRGARAGFWEWTPQGLNLTERGSTYFRQEGGKFISQATAGRRRLTRTRSRAQFGPGQQIEFFYECTELSPVAVALLGPAPVLAQEFLATAVVIPEGAAWRVESVVTRDYDEPLANLQEIASGVLK